MIDFIKSLGISADIEELSNKTILEFEGVHNVRTGEINERKQKAKYKDMTIEIVCNRHVNMFGSLHKCYNGGMHNYNDFTFDAFVDTTIDICCYCGLNPFHVPLNNLEFGVNIETNIAPKTIIRKNIINYKGKQPSINTFGGKGYLKEFILNQYIVKIYDKGRQFDQNTNILRFEVKVLKMEYLKKIGISNLIDLLNIEKLLELGELLDKVFDDLLMFDNDLISKNLSNVEQNIIQNATNPNYWENLMPDSNNYENGSKDLQYKKDRKTYYRKLEAFKKLVLKYGSNRTQKDLAESINIKWRNLLSINENTRDKLTIFLNSLQSGNKGQNDQVKAKNKKKEKGQINTSSIVSDCPIQKKMCLVTGLDISMQKENSKFLNIVGVRYHKKTSPEKFRELEKRLSEKWENSSLNVRFEEIAHSIRNEYYNKLNNPRNNTKRSIKKILSQPSLFDNASLIDVEKLKTANMLYIRMK